MEDCNYFIKGLVSTHTITVGEDLSDRQSHSQN